MKDRLNYVGAFLCSSRDIGSDLCEAAFLDTGFNDMLCTASTVRLCLLGKFSTLRILLNESIDGTTRITLPENHAAWTARQQGYVSALMPEAVVLLPYRIQPFDAYKKTGKKQID